MSKREQPRPPVHTVSDDAREAGLDMAAATLAAIHTSKQLRGEAIRLRPGDDLRPNPPTLPFGIGDILFGVAQLQVDFTRRLLEFNRGASKLLRDRLRENRDKSSLVDVELTTSAPYAETKVSIRNRSRLARQFTFSKSKSYAVVPPTITVAGSESEDVSVRFSALRPGINRGDITVLSRGVRVEDIHYEVEFKSEFAPRDGDAVGASPPGKGVNDRDSDG